MQSKLALVLAACVACAGTLRSQVIHVSNGIADVANAGGRVVLTRYCAEQMHAIGRTGSWNGAHCDESGDRAGTPATADERVHLDELRGRWRPVIEAADHVASAHAVVVGLIQATDDTSQGRIVQALGDLANAYQDLTEAARGLNVTLPSITGAP